MKAHNLRAILLALLNAEYISRVHLAKLTGLSTTTITNLISELIEQGIVIEEGAEKSDHPRSVGRPRTSLRLVDTFPQHDKATIVLGAAVDDLYEMRDFILAIKVGRRLITEYPQADANIRRGAWMVVAHASYDVEQYHEAELAYIETLKLTAQNDSNRVKLVDNLAASVYKQGEQANLAEDHRAAA